MADSMFINKIISCTSGHTKVRAVPETHNEFLKSGGHPFHLVHKIYTLFLIALITGVCSLADAKPLITGPGIYGVYPGTPFIHTLGAINTGTDRSFSVQGLPAGLTMDPKTGIITGTAPAKGRYVMKVSVTGNEGSASGEFEIRSGDTLAYTPPMGWNSWNKFSTSINETIFKKTVDAIVNLGLRDLGYQYICIDDSWSERNRNAAGDMVPNSTKFPGGIKALADYTHARGLKFGIYTDLGPVTFEGGAGSGGYFAHDAKMFADWGIDFVKCDLCSGPQDEAGASAKYKEFGQLLKNSGRSIIFSVCEWGRRRPWLWGKQAGQMWRTSWDLRDTWLTPTYTNASCGILNDLDVNDTLWKFSGPGGWNDMDMLFVGMHGEGFGSWSGMTDIEYRSHFSLWCLLASPLLLSKDLTIIVPEETKTTLLHEEIVAVNQDILGKQAKKIADNGNLETFARSLADGSQVVGFLNRGASSASMSVQWSQLGITGKKVVRDLWARTDLGVFENSYTCDVPTHDTKVFKIYAQETSSLSSGQDDSGKLSRFSWRIESGTEFILVMGTEDVNCLFIVNTQGKTVYRSMERGRQFHTISKSLFPPGVYVIMLINHQNSVESKTFIKYQ